ncbi:MAG: hypothetical protein WCE38_00475, partial [Burkholderiales bacterium]
MAVKLSALNLPFGKGKPEAKPAERKVAAKRPMKAAPDVTGRAAGAARVAKIGGMPLSRQTQVLAMLLIVFAAAAVVLT